MAQADRAGLSAAGRRAAITEAFRQSDSAQAFVNALRERGFRLRGLSLKPPRSRDQVLADEQDPGIVESYVIDIEPF